MPQPSHHIPHHSSAHRTAAIALYRALLSQSGLLNLPTTSTHTTQHLRTLIRNRFAQSRHVVSAPRLRLAFTAGYAALDHLDAAVAGNATSQTYLSNLLDRVPARSRTERWTPRRTRLRDDALAAREARRESARVAAREKADGTRIALFERPLPRERLSGGGERRVPVLVNANKIPMLRLKKPQPDALSQYIRGRIETRQAWQDRVERLEGERAIAREEDRWDGIVAGIMGDRKVKGGEGRKGREGTWVEEMNGALSEVRGLLSAERRKNAVMAQKMQAVVDREQAAYDEENAERKRQKTTKATG